MDFQADVGELETICSIFPGLTRIPFMPSLTISGIPPTLEAITGFALDIASRTAIGKFSEREGNRTISDDE